MSDWPMLKDAKRVSERVSALSDQRNPHEIMRICDELTGIIIDVDGVDYMLTMQVLPNQRSKPKVQ